MCRHVPDRGNSTSTIDGTAELDSFVNYRLPLNFCRHVVIGMRAENIVVYRIVSVSDGCYLQNVGHSLQSVIPSVFTERRFGLPNIGNHLTF